MLGAEQRFNKKPIEKLDLNQLVFPNKKERGGNLKFSIQCLKIDKII